jgi:hypothetical protein
MEEDAIVYSIALTLFVISLCFSVLVYRNREARIITARGLKFVCYQAISNIVFGLLFLSSIAHRDTCMGMIVLLSFFPLYALPLTMRYIVYYFKFHLAQRVVSPDKGTFFVKYQYLITPRYLTIGYVILYIAQNIPVVMTVRSQQVFYLDDEGTIRCQELYQYYFTQIYILTCFLLTLVGLIGLRKAMDAYSIKQEFIIYLVKVSVVMALTLVFGTMEIINQSSYETGILFFLILLVVDLVGDFIISIVRVWWLSRKELRDKAIILKMSTDIEIGSGYGYYRDPITLTAFLSDLKMREIFRQHLILQFCAESLCFWEAVQDWMALTCAETKRSKAIEIYDKFFASSSPFEINIDSGAKSKISNCIANNDFPDNLFQPALDGVEESLLYHSYPNFKRAHKELDLPKALIRFKAESILDTL